MTVEIPDMDSMASRWQRYLQHQDLTGYDRERIAELGAGYLAQAVEETAS